MFENLIKNIEALNGKKLSFAISEDDDGYTDRECPFDDCQFQFKVLSADWRDKFKDEAVFCPFCGHQATSDDFWTKNQIANGREQALKYIQNEFSRALSDWAKDFNRHQDRNGFITMSMKYEGKVESNYLLPINAEKELEQKIACSECGARYGVLWSAYFCPCCGHNSIDETFDTSIRKIEVKIKNIELIRKTVAEINPDEAQITVQSLIETGLSDMVVAFQRFCEATYKKLTKDKPVKTNAFQNLEIGDTLWNEVLGKSYRDWISQKDYETLNIIFQKRHLLSHQEGIVDNKYIEKTGDTKYKVGQRIVVREDDVNEWVRLILEIIWKIKEATPLLP